MKTNKSKVVIVVLTLILVIGAALTGCSVSNSDAQTTTTAPTSLDVSYSDEDMDASWNPELATYVTLKDGGSTIDGTGIAINSSTDTITVNQAGTYVFTGSLSTGQIVVDAGKDDSVHLVLNQVEISCSDGPAISVNMCDKTVISIEKGSDNTVSGGEAAVTTDSDTKDALDAAIYSLKDLTINGSGSLEVTSDKGNGIKTKDDLVITGGKITVNAANDALRGRDSVAILDGTFTLNAGDDGIQSNNDEDLSKGWISIDGGSYRIDAKQDGLKAETLLQVTSGRMNIKSGEDALHSNTNILVADGTIHINAGDDALHADSMLAVKGGTLRIKQCYEGLESLVIDVSGGTIDLKAEDDGLNGAGGNDGSSQSQDSPQQDNFAAVEGCIITISGGTLSINAGGDGIDSNGDLAFSGGTVNVSGPTNDGNGPMDYNGTCKVTGGTLAIAGSAGMAQSPSDSSTQSSITVFFQKTMAAGTKISVKDSDGKTILSYAPFKEFESIVLSSKQLKQGETYTIYSGSVKCTDVSLSSIVTSISSDGTAASAGGAGQGNPPGQNSHSTQDSTTSATP